MRVMIVGQLPRERVGDDERHPLVGDHIRIYPVHIVYQFLRYYLRTTVCPHPSILYEQEPVRIVDCQINVVHGHYRAHAPR